MNNLYNYKEFVNEAKKKKEWTDVERVMDGIKNILENSFTFAKKPEYEYDAKGFPKKVTFMVDAQDYKLDWKGESLKTDYTEAVALKHVYDVELDFDSKEEKEDKMFMTFSVKFHKVTEKEKLPKWKEEKKKKEEEDEEPEVRSKDEEWYGKDDDDEVDEEEIDKKAKEKAEKKKK